ncbi:hypothetical protein ABW19_dt0205197 [Dactylella cylindrospora]|nr:hypothetical protein ABW19_dt0205197 [Dactylella cylindrospora]
MDPSPALLIPEILEVILLGVPAIEVLTSIRAVCRTWKSVVETSPELQYYTEIGFTRAQVKSLLANRDRAIIEPLPLAFQIIQKFWAKVRRIPRTIHDSSPVEERDGEFLERLHEVYRSVYGVARRAHLFLPEMRRAYPDLGLGSPDSVNDKNYSYLEITEWKFGTSWLRIPKDQKNRFSELFEDDSTVWMEYPVLYTLQLICSTVFRRTQSLPAPDSSLRGKIQRFTGITLGSARRVDQDVDPEPKSMLEITATVTEQKPSVYVIATIRFFYDSHNIWMSTVAYGERGQVIW